VHSRSVKTAGQSVEVVVTSVHGQTNKQVADRHSNVLAGDAIVYLD
jgi:hypothetical protein